MNAPSRAILVPPRPNLGPEPLTGPGSLTGSWLFLGLVLGLVALLLGWRRVRVKTRRGEPRVALTALLDRTPDSPRVEMVAWSEAVREALVVRFGPAWRAKTTEEMAADSTLLDALGPERTGELVRFLKVADHAKFAVRGGPLADAQSDAWRSWVAVFVSESASAAGASSRIKGK